MPHSLVLNLIPRSTIYPDFLTGRHMHALFLTLVSAVNQELGDKLHEAKTDKAFTLSPLQIQTQRLREPLQYQHSKPIPAGTPCWFRISLLDDRLFGQLTQLWLNLNNFAPEGGRGGWHLGSADLTIASILGTPQAAQPWANACSYQELFDRASDQIMGDVAPLQIKQLNALADFALYAGVGRKTPMGMGMVRRVSNK